MIGAGLAGLAARAAIASGLNTLTIEGAEKAGGLARVFPRSGFVFDSVPHVLQLRSQRLVGALASSLPGGLRWFPKDSLVYQEGASIRYPYQFNACDLPAPIRAQCLQGLDDISSDAPPESFSFWLIQQFGRGFYECFFEPYNRKLYREPLSALDASPLKWTIPANNREAIENGAREPWPEPAPEVAYPTGPLGIEELVHSLERASSSPIRLNSRLISLDPLTKMARTSDGLEIRWQTAIATLPLPVLSSLLPAPASGSGAEALRATSITVVEVGARESGPGLPAIWTYLPDAATPFYRLTRLERLSPALAPIGGTAVLLEASGELCSNETASVELLNRLSILDPSSVEHFAIRSVPYAYVLFLPGHRRQAVRLRKELAEHDVFTAGRYGAWLYADIEMTLKSGLAAAAAVLERLGQRDARRDLSWEKIFAGP